MAPDQPEQLGRVQRVGEHLEALNLPAFEASDEKAPYASFIVSTLPATYLSLAQYRFPGLSSTIPLRLQLWGGG